MQDPIGQMFSFEYIVTGSWSDPRVERSDRTANAAAAPGGAQTSPR
jgi:uncharacterized protein YhdP